MRASRYSRLVQAVSAIAAGMVLTACGNLLDVEFPGRIPSEQINDPTLAPVLARSVIGDLECAYNNYFAGSAVHSDEFETSNSNVPGANWGERGINADEDDYVIGGCETTSLFGIFTPMHTARFQAADVFQRISGWTDAQVPNRATLLATVKAYGAFPYVFFGETFCSVSFDGGPEQAPSTSLVRAETEFTEALALAQAAGDADILNLARVGLARTKLDLKKYAEAATVAALVPGDYEKNAGRGAETSRRFNKLFQYASQLGAYVVADAFRTAGDPRIKVLDTGRGAFNPTIRLWIQTKYPTVGSPIPLASGREARLIQAEGLAETGDLSGAMAILNARRAAIALPPLTATTKDQVIAAVLSERRAELSFEGGHRLNDILRRRLPWKGAQGSTVVANPYTGRLYGATTCWPHPTKEKNGA